MRQAGGLQNVTRVGHKVEWVLGYKVQQNGF